jgi:hypothetical protein
MMAVTVAALAMTACSQAAEPELTVVSTSATIAATTVRSSTTTVLASTTTLIAEPTTTSSTLAPLPPLPALLAAQVDELVAITEELRGLQFIEPPMIEVLTPEEVTERRREILEEDLDRDELAYEEAFYKLVGIFGPDDDLYDFYTSFYSAGTLAYYDLEDQRLIVPLAGDTLNEYEKWILVHELTHALMDQHYGEVADRFENSDEDGDFDEIGSILSLLEGEAVLIQTLYLHGLDSTRRAEVVEIAGQHSNPTFGSAPQFFRELIRFPYTAGSLLTSDLYRRGGTEAINQAFEQPPRSTEHVLHVESYLELEPIVSIEPLEISLDGYEVAEEGTWGERGWRVLLDHYLASERRHVRRAVRCRVCR